MATYVFKAMDLTGAKATGEVEAENKQVVSEQLKSRGLIVLDISDKHSSKQLNVELFNKLKATDLAVMTRQLATMVQSGMTILRALYVLEAQTENKMLTNAVIAVRKDVEAGLPLSDALERHPKIFSKTGTRKVTSASSTSTANPPISDGYIIADLTCRRSESSFSS